jgi:hypothetical protein
MPLTTMVSLYMVLWLFEVEASEDIHTKCNEEGRTPMMIACQEGRLDAANPGLFFIMNPGLFFIIVLSILFVWVKQKAIKCCTKKNVKNFESKFASTPMQ